MIDFQVKVCGMQDAVQVAELVNSEKVTMIGHLFYSLSKRFYDGPNLKIKNAKKVGVFVNQSSSEIFEKIKLHELNYVQLHGNESAEFCLDISKKCKVIKAFGLDDSFDFNILKNYEAFVDLFLFDTKTIEHGGSGKSFNWKILDQYKGNIPFLLSGGINMDSVMALKKLNFPKLIGFDINSGFEIKPGNKNVELIKKFIENMQTNNCIHQPDELGFYGEFGGAFVPELLRSNLEELKLAYKKYSAEEEFQIEFNDLLKNYVGRPTPLFLSKKLSEKYGCTLFLKREDLNHTGSHKINNAIGQILLAKRIGKTKILAETGAGQHGVATATVCALMDMECVIFMGEIDMERQAANVDRMRYLGAKVIPATSGSKTLKDATNEAIRHWINNPDSYYLIGSVVGPHPYPQLVAEFQSVISKEIKSQLQEITGSENPTKVIACVGGGSNAAGAFYEFYEEKNVELFAIEAAGMGIESGFSAATSFLGKQGVIHGSMTLLMQDEFGQIKEPHSISAGLDYPGIGPLHAHTIQVGRVKAIAITDEEALLAAKALSQSEGIIPALESAHALAALEKINFNANDVVVVNLSGRGDKDLAQIIKIENEKSKTKVYESI